MRAVNIPVRLKNPWFWVGVISIAIASIGLDPTTMTTWGAVWAAAVAVLHNPVQLVTVVLAVLVWTFLKMDDKITALQKRVDELEAAQKNAEKPEK